jgi:hypothetical protein
MIAPKENSSGIIPIFKETFTEFPQCFDTGRKSLSKSSKSRAAVATEAPSGIPGKVVAKSASGETELDEIKLVSVIRTPRIDSRI